MSKVNEIGDSSFEQEVLASPLPVLVDYWADWCAPCKQLSPVLDELSEQYDGRVRFVKLDTNANVEVPAAQGVLSLPTLQLFVDGQLVQQITGGKTRAALVKLLDEYA